MFWYCFIATFFHIIWLATFLICFSVSQEEISKLQADHDQVGQELFDTKQQLLDQLDANHVFN